MRFFSAKHFSSTFFTCETERLRHVLEARHPLPCRVGCTDTIKEHSMANHTDVSEPFYYSANFLGHKIERDACGQLPIFERISIWLMTEDEHTAVFATILHGIDKSFFQSMCSPAMLEATVVDKYLRIGPMSVDLVVVVLEINEGWSQCIVFPLTNRERSGDHTLRATLPSHEF